MDARTLSTYQIMVSLVMWKDRNVFMGALTRRERDAQQRVVVVEIGLRSPRSASPKTDTNDDALGFKRTRRNSRRAGPACALLVLFAAFLLFACSSEEAPVDELDTFLRDVAAAEDDYFAKEHTYTGDIGDLEGIDADTARAMNLVINVNPDVGYCVEGDDEAGTWHISQGSDAVIEGDCPRHS